MNRRSVVLYIGTITYIEKHIETVVLMSRDKE